MDKDALGRRIMEAEGLSDEDKAALVGLLREGKRYGLVWEDKPEDVEERLREELPVLTEVRERAIVSGDADAPNHTLIEGDNLEALTTLSYTHDGRVDVIYIDPPYNTGNRDFVYNDRYVDREDGYRHSKWLSFMHKRLKLARQLLSDRGVIFISIDDNEQAQLKLLCDEVFGEERFVANIPWRKRTAKSDVPFGISQDCENVLCYANSEFKAATRGSERKYYETMDFPNRPWRFHDLTTQRTVEERPNSNYTMINPKTGEEFPVNPLRCWAVTIDTFQQYYDDNRIIFPGDYDFLNISKPVLRYWKEDDMKKAGADFGLVAVSTHLPSNVVGMTQDGTKEITELFGEKKFGYPKPIGLIKYLIGIATARDGNAVLLDFFAGSGTTLHATMQLNAEDGGRRQCILVTNNENNICEEVTYERNRRVIEGYTTPGGKAVAGLRGNSLRYYRTAFVPRERTSANMRRLTSLATDMLCIRNNVYTEAALAGSRADRSVMRYFADGERRMLVVYREECIPQIVPSIAEALPAGGRMMVYVFSPSADPYGDEFEDVIDRVELCPLPAAIYEAYKRVLPRRGARAGADENETT